MQCRHVCGNAPAGIRSGTGSRQRGHPDQPPAPPAIHRMGGYCHCRGRSRQRPGCLAERRRTSALEASRRKPRRAVRRTIRARLPSLPAEHNGPARLRPPTPRRLRPLRDTPTALSIKSLSMFTSRILSNTGRTSSRRGVHVAADTLTLPLLMLARFRTERAPDKKGELYYSDNT